MSGPLVSFADAKYGMAFSVSKNDNTVIFKVDSVSIIGDKNSNEASVIFGTKVYDKEQKTTRYPMVVNEKKVGEFIVREIGTVLVVCIKRDTSVTLNDVKVHLTGHHIDKFKPFDEQSTNKDFINDLEELRKSRVQTKSHYNQSKQLKYYYDSYGPSILMYENSDNITCDITNDRMTIHLKNINDRVDAEIVVFELYEPPRRSIWWWYILSILGLVVGAIVFYFLLRRVIVKILNTKRGRDSDTSNLSNNNSN